MNGKLNGKVALVTGAGRGIGHAIALKLAREGASVIVNDLDAGPAGETVDAIVAAGGRATVLAGSVTAADFGERAVQACVESYGGLDIIVNNAGYTWDGVIHKMSDDQWQAMLDVHLTAPFRILRAAYPVIKRLRQEEKEKGLEVFRKVVNISSIVGMGGNAGQANYSSAKAGVIGLTKTLSKEWGHLGVNVNCVAFGHIETRLTQPLDGDPVRVEIEGKEIRLGVGKHMLEVITSQVPLGRGGSIEEAADAVYMFCSPESNYVSGQVLVCGGGLALA